MKKRLIAAILVGVMAVATLAGCGGKSENNTPADNGGTEAEGGDVDVSTTDPETMVVLTAQTWNASFSPMSHTTIIGLRGEQLAYDNLVDYDEATGKYTESLAEAWEVAEDGTVTLKLKEGVKFHDGSDFTAEDAAASITEYSNPDNASGTWFSEQLIGTVVDDYTVSVQTASGAKLASIVGLLAIVPMMSSDDLADIDNTIALGYNGTGQWKFNKYEDGTVYLDANEEYWGQVPVQIKHIVYKYVADSTTRLSALQNNQADIIERVESDQVAVIEGASNVDYFTVTTSEVQQLIFKLNVEPMNDPLVREAICCAIDRETIVNDILGGYAVLGDSVVAPATWGYAKMDLPAYDPERAAALLKEAGYENGNGLPTITFKTGVGFYPKTKEIGEYITACLNAVGIQVEFEPLEVGEWLDIYNAVDGYCMTQSGWQTMAAEPDLKVNPYYLNGYLSGGYEPDELYNLVVKFNEETDEAARAAIFSDEILPVLSKELIDLPLYFSVDIYGVANGVKDYTVNSYGVYDFTNTTK